jgi:hypothetical protein
MIVRDRTRLIGRLPLIFLARGRSSSATLTLVLLQNSNRFDETREAHRIPAFRTRSSHPWALGQLFPTTDGPEGRYPTLSASPPVAPSGYESLFGLNRMVPGLARNHPAVGQKYLTPAKRSRSVRLVFFARPLSFLFRSGFGLPARFPERCRVGEAFRTVSCREQLTERPWTARACPESLPHLAP